MKQNREHRNRPTQTYPTDFQKGYKEIQRREDNFSKNGVGAIGHP